MDKGAFLKIIGNFWAAVVVGGLLGFGLTLQPPATAATGTEAETLAVAAHVAPQGDDGAAEEQDTVPQEVDNATDGIATVSVGGGITMAVDNSGILWGWGSNFDNRLRIGEAENSQSPVQIMENVVAVSTRGFSRTMAIDSNGTLWSWGLNEDGQLGDGTTEPRFTPVPITLGYQ